MSLGMKIAIGIGALVAAYLAWRFLRGRSTAAQAGAGLTPGSPAWVAALPSKAVPRHEG